MRFMSVFYRNTVLLALSACIVFAGCSRVRLDMEESGPELSISVGGDFATRSAVTNSGASQHIEHMYLYIFDGKTADSKCFYARDLDWIPVDGTGLSDFTYRLRDARLSEYGDKELTFLVIGVDNHYETYSFPMAGLDDHEKSTLGKSLGEVKATVAAAVSGTENIVYAMAHTELFAGVSVQSAADQIFSVTVKRCVAGVMCYLTDIPYLVGSGEDSKVTSIELRLNSDAALNRTVNLFDGDMNYSPSGSEPLTEAVQSYGTVIASADLSQYMDRQSSQGQENTLLYIPPVDDGTVKTLENSVLFGAYMVPVSVIGDSADNTDATLSIAVKGKNGYEQIYYVRNNAESHTAGPGGHEVAVDGRDYSYSIQADRMYAIGKKPFTGDTEGDRPASLAGTELELSPEDWLLPDADVEFPSYSLSASILPGFNPEGYFDCIGVPDASTGVTDTLDILPASGNKKWTLTALDPDTGKAVDWIQFRFKGESEWTEGTLSGSDPAPDILTVEMRVFDYADRNDDFVAAVNEKDGQKMVDILQKDYRTAILTLETEDAGSKTLAVNQYNAITVYVEEQDDYVAFARKDLMASEQDKASNFADTDGYSYTGWGFFSSIPSYIYGERSDYNDGEVNSNNAYSFAYSGKYGSSESNYNGSALKRGRTPWTEGGESGRYWYTPSQNEMKAFFENVVVPVNSVYHLSSGTVPVVNIKCGCLYWTSSSAYYDRGRSSYTYRLNGSNVAGEAETDRDDHAYIRQARKFQ